MARRIVAWLAPILLFASGFGLGRLTAPGPVLAPVDASEPVRAVRVEAPPEMVSPPAKLRERIERAEEALAVEAVTTLCGMPTRSGLPCKRKVKGVGPCYQHR